MGETHDTLAIFVETWQTYQDHLSTALGPLTPDQLRPGSKMQRD